MIFCSKPSLFKLQATQPASKDAAETRLVSDLFLLFLIENDRFR